MITIIQIHDQVFKERECSPTAEVNQILEFNGRENDENSSISGQPSLYLSKIRLASILSEMDQYSLKFDYYYKTLQVFDFDDSCQSQSNYVRR